MKKVSTLIIIVLSIVLIFVFGYVGYGSTMINIENEKSIINHLSSNKNNPILVLFCFDRIGIYNQKTVSVFLSGENIYRIVFVT